MPLLLFTAGENELFELRMKKTAEILAGLSKGNAFRLSNILFLLAVIISSYNCKYLL